VSGELFPISVAILLLCGACFWLYRFFRGWHTGTVRVPLLNFRVEYDRKTDPLNFWLVLILTAVLSAGALVFAVAFWRDA